jgi:hypothetical protein
LGERQSPGKGFSLGDKYSKMGLGIFWGNKLKWHFLRNKPHDIYKNAVTLCTKVNKIHMGPMAYSTAILNDKIAHFPIERCS